MGAWLLLPPFLFVFACHALAQVVQPESPDSIRAMIRSDRLAPADSSARILLRWAEAEHGQESLESADALDLLVESLWRAGKGVAAETRSLAERSVRIRERLLPPDDLRLAVSWTNLARVLDQAGDRTEARSLLQRSLALQERLLGEEHLDIAATLEFLGSVQNDLGEEEAARSSEERSLKIREHLLNPDDPLIAESLNDLANVLTDTGEYDNALGCYARALSIRERAFGNDDPRIAIPLANLARLKHRLGDFVGARSDFERAARIQERALGPNDRRLGYTLTFFGLTLQALGDYGAAEKCLKRALSVRRNALGPDHILVATTLGILADLYREMGEDRKAKPVYEEALGIRTRKSDPGDPNLAVTLQGLAWVLAGMGKVADAESLETRALSILEAAYGPTHSIMAEGLRSAAQVRLRSGDAAGSREMLERALAIETTTLGPDHPETASTREWMARTLWAAGDSIGALKAGLAAETAARKHLRRTGRRLSDREALQYGHARTAGLGISLTIASAGLPESQLQSVLDMVIRSRAVVLDEMATRHRPYTSQNDPAIDSLGAKCALAVARYANLIVQGPSGDGRGFQEELKRRQDAEESAERALAERDLSFHLERSAAEAGIEDVARHLPPRSAMVAYVRYEVVPRVYAGMGGTAPLSSTGQAAYAAFVLSDSGRSIHYLPLGAAGTIEAAISRWARESGRGLLRPGRSERQAELDDRTAGVQLRRLIWDPLAAALGGKNRVFVVPDGNLNLIPFSALPSDGGRYLIETGPLIEFLSAERDLVPRPEPQRMNQGLLALGGLAFDEPRYFAALSSGRRRSRERAILASAPAQVAPPVPERAAASYRGPHSPCGRFQSVRFEPLPGTAGEVRDVADEWRKALPAARGRAAERELAPDSPFAALLLGPAGDEGTFKRDAPLAGVLHLATHGFFIDGSCGVSSPKSRGIGGLAVPPSAPMPPARMGSPKDRPPAAHTQRMPRSRAQFAVENPLLLSGLALAGANHRDVAGEDEEDGILTAEEIAALDLSGVRCAILSACDTGVGRATTGEGVLGLRRSFEIAGVRTLIMSLWSVEDQSTRRWMRLLYQGWLVRGLSPAGAARDASLALLRDRRAHGQSTHPFFWAGFVVAGGAR